MKRNHKLYISLILASSSFVIFKSFQESGISFILSWIVFTLSSLIFAWITILTFKAKETGKVATEDNSGTVPTFLTILICTMVSLLTIIYLAINIPEMNHKEISFIIFLPFLSINLSWFMIHSVFTLWYAHLYYTYKSKNHKDNGKHEGGLEFPRNSIDDENENHPEFLDFAYFSFVIGMTFQVSDVEISERRIRKIALIHALISFIFNTIIVAMTINILVGVVGK